MRAWTVLAALLLPRACSLVPARASRGAARARQASRRAHYDPERAWFEREVAAFRAASDEVCGARAVGDAAALTALVAAAVRLVLGGPSLEATLAEVAAANADGCGAPAREKWLRVVDQTLQAVGLIPSRSPASADELVMSERVGGALRAASRRRAFISASDELEASLSRLDAERDAERDPPRARREAEPAAGECAVPCELPFEELVLLAQRAAADIEAVEHAYPGATG
jgi:hypothetical protein